MLHFRIIGSHFPNRVEKKRRHEDRFNSPMALNTELFFAEPKFSVDGK